MVRNPFGAILSLALAVAAGPLAAQEGPGRPVIVTEVTAQDGGIARQFFGHVAAAQTVDLAFQVGGRLTSLPAVEGQTIPAGGLVAELDLDPFQLAYDQALLRADQADRALERLIRLQGSSASEVAVEDARTEAQLAALAVDSAALDLENATLRAPFDALVASRNVANFSTVSAGAPVVRLHDMSELRIEIDVPEILFQRASQEPDLDIIARFPAIDGDFPVEIREFNAEASEVGQTFRITLGMEPPEGHVILPGSSATILARLHEGHGAPVIPPSAVAIAADGTTSVLVYEESGENRGILRRRPVELAADDQGIPVALSGVEPGDEIVAAGVNALEDGMAVRRFTGFPD